MTANQIAYQVALETARSNRAREAETYRSNVARELETNRSNVASEGETRRSNLVNEGLKTRAQIESEKMGESNRSLNKSKIDKNTFDMVNAGVNTVINGVSQFLPTKAITNIVKSASGSTQTTIKSIGGK